MVQEIDIYVDLIAVFSLKKIPTLSQDLSQIEHIGNINITEVLKYFQFCKFKTTLKFIKSN